MGFNSVTLWQNTFYLSLASIKSMMLIWNTWLMC